MSPLKYIITNAVTLDSNKLSRLSVNICLYKEKLLSESTEETGVQIYNSAILASRGKDFTRPLQYSDRFRVVPHVTRTSHISLICVPLPDDFNVICLQQRYVTRDGMIIIRAWRCLLRIKSLDGLVEILSWVGIEMFLAFLQCIPKYLLKILCDIMSLYQRCVIENFVSFWAKRNLTNTALQKWVNIIHPRPDLCCKWLRVALKESDRGCNFGANVS